MHSVPFDSLYCIKPDPLTFYEQKQSSNKIEESEKERNSSVCIPIQSNSEISDIGDVWRIWSCIRLAYLLRDAISSLSEEVNHSSSSKTTFRNFRYKYQLKQRGRYLTRREGKYWWQTLKEIFTEK